ncbi:MAG: Ig-like domain-containing protein [Chloroflexales bacterium]
MYWSRIRSGVGMALALMALAPIALLITTNNVQAGTAALTLSADPQNQFSPSLAVQNAAFAATAHVDPQIQYLNDTTGTVFSFTINNTGSSAMIGAVEIDRPANQWTIVACPTAPAGWSAQRSDDKCRYRSAQSTSDDIKPGQSVSTFHVKATTLVGSADRSGAWKVVVSKSNQFDTPSLLATATADPLGLGITAYSWQILDAIIDGGPATSGSRCPAATAANHSAITGSSGHTVVICGKNRMNVAATPQAAQSSLGGSFIASAGSFSSGSISANCLSSVVLGTWSTVTITASAGTGKTVIAKIGSATNQTSPLTTLNGYEAKNQPPLAANDTYAVNEDTTLTVSAPGALANDSDPDGNPITAVLIATTAHGTLVLNASGSFSYAPAANYNGLDSFTYKAQDSFSALSNLATVSITVNPVNDAPTASGQGVNTNEDTPKLITLSGNDIDSASLSFTIVSGPSHGGLSAIGAPTCASGSCSATLTYTPAANDNGADSFTFKANDGALDSAPATVSITINAVDDPPVAVNDTAAMTEDDPATAINVLANDTDIDGGPQSIASVAQPANGTVIITGGGTGLSYQPKPNFCNTPPGTAPDTFTYTLAPGGSTATVSVRVTCVNDAPVAVNDAYAVNEDATLNTAGPGVLGNDTDVENDPLTVVLVNGPAHGALTLNANGSFSYTPSANYNGADSFTYKANDLQADSNLATVSIAVAPVNDVPTANSQTATTDQDKAVTIGLSGSDVESCDLTFGIVTPPAHGALGSIASSACIAGTPNTDSASVVYTPASGYNGPDSFTYKVTDGGDGASSALDSAPATVSITVNPPNAAPVVSPAAFAIAENSGNGASVGTVTAHDPDSGQTITFAFTAGNTAGAFVIDANSGAITVANSAALDFEATPTFGLTVTATDNGVPPTSGSATITISLTNVNEAPTDIALSNASVAENQPVGTTVGTLSTSDPDAGDTQTYTLVAGTGSADNSLFQLVGSALQTNAAFDFEAKSSYSIRVRSTDSGGLFSEKPFTISITNLNEAPTDIALLPASVAENQPSGTTVGTLTTSDPDAGDTQTYTLVSGTGSADNGSFQIAGGTLQTTAMFDFETKSGYSIRVRSTDSGGLFSEKQLTVSITNLNEAPTDIALASANVDENQPVGTTVGAFSTTDPDTGDSFTYALVAGTGDGDNGSFQIVGGTLQTTAMFDFETKSSYSIRVRSTDSGGLSTEKQFAITINNLNDPPTLASIEGGPLAFSEGDAPTAVTASMTASDPDSPNLAGATVTISVGYQSGQDVLAFTSQLGITGSFNAVSGVLTLTGSAPPADYQTALRTVTFGNASDNPSTAARTITFKVNDGALDSNIASRQVTVAAVNDAPVNTVPLAQTVNEETNLVFSTANSNAISSADVDAGSSAVKLSLDVANGTLTLASASGLTFVDGTANGQASVHMTGSITAINTALNGLTYRGGLNYNATRGSEALLIVTNDQGNTGTGGALSDTSTVAISVSPVNDAPTAQAQSYGANSIQANMKRSVVAASGLLVGASDPDTGDAGYTATFTVGTVNGVAPSGGTINATIAGVGTVTADASSGAFDFDPAPGVTGNVGFTYTICDSGNPAPAACSAPASVTFTIAGPVIWFVNPTAAANGDGRLSSPFSSLAAADAVDGANQRIFLYTGTAASGISLNSGEWLVGQGLSGASFDAVMGISPPAGTIARPSIGGTRPTVQGTVTLAGNAAIKGLNISSGAATGLTDPAGAISGGSVSEVGVTSTTGVAVSLSDDSSTFSLTSVSANGAANGIALTNTTGSFSVTGDSGSANNSSGGSIQNITNDGILLSNVQNIALDQMNIQSTGNNGINGALVTNFSFTNGTINASGNTAFESNIAFNGSGTSVGNNINGTLTVTGNTLTNAYYSGLDVQSDNGSVTNATISNNTITSTADVATSKGYGINLVGTGNASTAFNLDNATISGNAIANFPSGGGIQVSIGNSNPTGPGAHAGVPGDSTKVVAITNNAIAGNSTLNPMNTSAIIVANSGGNSGSRTKTNVTITNNGTSANPITNIRGTAILIGNNGYADMTGTVDSNWIVANNTLGSNGIGGGNGVAGAGNAWTPDMTLTVTNNTISQTDGNGILLVGRGTSGIARFKIQNNTVAAPLSGVRPGIRVDAGNTASANDTVFVNISGNTSAGSGGTNGIGLRKQGTVSTINVFGINGLSPSPAAAAAAAAYVSGLNPAGNGVLNISGDSFVTCSLP